MSLRRTFCMATAAVTLLVSSAALAQPSKATLSVDLTYMYAQGTVAVRNGATASYQLRLSNAGLAREMNRIQTKGLFKTALMKQVMYDVITQLHGNPLTAWVMPEKVTLKVPSLGFEQTFKTGRPQFFRVIGTGKDGQQKANYRPRNETGWWLLRRSIPIKSQPPMP